mmetsp:Transcript_27986/g.63329  ORF Transcript_27986/g.63329 Transcript_27986/m.63329 type:complete len:238 (+) Transcript_27986:457-1170(+)
MTARRVEVRGRLRLADDASANGLWWSRRLLVMIVRAVAVGDDVRARVLHAHLRRQRAQQHMYLRVAVAQRDPRALRVAQLVVHAHQAAQKLHQGLEQPVRQVVAQDERHERPRQHRGQRLWPRTLSAAYARDQQPQHDDAESGQPKGPLVVGVQGLQAVHAAAAEPCRRAHDQRRARRGSVHQLALERIRRPDHHEHQSDGLNADETGTGDPRGGLPVPAKRGQQARDGEVSEHDAV